MSFRKLAIIAIALLLLPGALLPSSSTAGGGEGAVAVLFDFGDGRWAWSDVTVPDPANAWCATVAAADALGFALEHSFSQYGVYLETVDGVDTPDDFSAYWGLWSWDDDGGVWESSLVGAIDLEVQAGSSLAWRFAAWGEPGPDPNPLTRDPWLSFRGGKVIQGVSTSSGLPAAAEFWSKDLGSGPIDSTLAVADGKVFGISSGIYDWNDLEFTQLPTVFALDAGTGELLWDHEFTDPGGFEIGSPAYHNGMVLAPLSNGDLVALDAGTGETEWQAGVDPEGLSSSPTVADELVLTGTKGGRMVALHSGNGSVAWEVNVSGEVYLAQPTVWEGSVYIGTENGTVHALSLDDGTEVWTFEKEGRFRGTPLVTGDGIYLIRGVYDGFIPKEGYLLALDMEGDEGWEVDIGTTGSSPAIFGDLVVVGSTGGLRAFGTDGTPEWSFTEGGAVSSSPAVAGERAYFMTNENSSAEGLHTTVFSLSPNGREDWRKELEPHNWALASVAIADGRIYVATDAGHVYCLGDTPFQADFAWAAEGGHVTLNDTSGSYGASLVGWRWQNLEFGELRDQNVTVRFNASGEYPVTLLVYDEFGRKVAVTKNVTVVLPDLIAGFTYVIEGMTVTLTANGTAPDLGIDRYAWGIEGAADPLVGQEVTYEFKRGGRFQVTLEVTDEYGREDSGTQSVVVEEEGDVLPDSTARIAILFGVIIVLAIIVVVAPRRGKVEE